jgi:cytochrome c oxidase subunit II
MSSTAKFARKLLTVRAVGGATGVALAVCLASGCSQEHPQSMLHAAGPGAATIASLWWALFAICTGVFAVVLGMLFVAILVRRKENRDELPGSRFIAVTGIIVPTVILLVILVVSLRATVQLQAKESDSLTIRVIGHQWWWEVHYVEQGIVDANEIHIPTNTPVRFELVSADVIHSFWVPNLGGKMDMVPEHSTYLVLEADRPGQYRGQCAEYCGGPHAKMAFPVIAVSPSEFDEWIAQKSQPPVTDDARLVRGREVFFAAACDNCHAIVGTEAAGRVGPDLTHMGSRLTLGAGAIANTRENLIQWIRDPHVAKPGNRMPHSSLTQPELETLADYLLHLK